MSKEDKAILAGLFERNSKLVMYREVTKMGERVTKKKPGRKARPEDEKLRADLKAWAVIENERARIRVVGGKKPSIREAAGSVGADRRSHRRGDDFIEKARSIEPPGLPPH